MRVGRADGRAGGLPDDEARSGPARLGAAVRDGARLVLPVECPGCGRWDVRLCRACATGLTGPPWRCEQDAPRLDRMDGRAPLPVWAVAPYAGAVRGIVRCWKDEGRADLTGLLLGAMTQGAAAVAADVGSALLGEPLAVVPVPTSAAARRRRGGDLVRLLAEAVAAGLRAGGVDARRAPVLTRRRGARDQAGLGARARGANLSGAVTVRPGAAVGGRWHLLVDDVLTTGATLRGCAEAVSGSGGLVLAGLVLAATPAPARGPQVLLDGRPED